MRIAQLLAAQCVMVPLAAKTKRAALEQLVGAVAAARGIDACTALRDLEMAQRAGAPLLEAAGRGVALPHAASSCCRQLLVAAGVAPEGIPWGPRGEPAHLVFMLLGPPQTRPLYLRALGRIARLCSDGALVERLVACDAPSRLTQAITDAEESLGEMPPDEQLPRFCVMGAGPGGMAMAGHLALTGCRVNLYTRNAARLEPLLARGGIDVTGEVEGFAPLNRITTSPGEALEDVDVIMVVVPATAHRDIAALVAPHLKDGQILILNPGRTGGALEVAQVLRGAAPAVRLFLAEAQTLLYASRMTNPGQVHIHGIKNSVPLAALPAYQIADILPVVRSALPQFVPGDNVLKTSLDNIGAVFHPAITILNAARIEDTHGDFEYYVQGVTPAVARVLEAIDDERVAVAAALGVRAHTAREWLYLAYNAPGRTLLEAMQANAGYRGIKAAGTLQHRYISEDVPASLVPIASIGEMLGVPTPNIRAIIQLACTIHGVDYRAEGRTVDKLGIKGMTVKDIRFLVVGAEPTGQRNGEGETREIITL